MYKQLYRFHRHSPDDVQAKNLDLPVVRIKPVIAYYLHDSRNAWHNTTVTNYNMYLGEDSCFNRFVTACNAAERRRVQGSVFHITEESALHLVGMCNSLLLLHMATPRPFADLCKNEVAGELNSLLVAAAASQETPRVSFRQMVKLLLPEGKYWKVRPRHFLFEYSAEKKSWLDELRDAPLRRWESRSLGGGQNLQWQEYPHDIEHMAVTDLAQCLNRSITEGA